MRIQTAVLVATVICLLGTAMALAACSNAQGARSNSSSRQQANLSSHPPEDVASGQPTEWPSSVAPTLPASTPENTATVQPTNTPNDVTPGQPANVSNYVVNGLGNSNVEQAHALLQAEGNRVYLIFISAQSTGVGGEIYRDLIQRNFRTTTGGDEGIDTHGEFCYPYCVYVPVQDANVISVDAWVLVLRHEYRHITQALNNPTLAQDFKFNGLFTPYAAFSEACADYGLNVAPVYHAQERIDQLERVLGAGQQGLIDQACSGVKSAYQTLVSQYNQKVGNGNAFQTLFPPYQ